MLPECHKIGIRIFEDDYLNGVFDLTRWVIHILNTLSFNQNG
jgi:hypothetical protein